MEKKKDYGYLGYVFGTFAIIFVLWFMKTYIFTSILDNMGEWGSAIVESLLKCIILLIIPIWMIKNKKVNISFNDMFKNKIDWEFCAPILVAFVIKSGLEMYTRFGGFGISHNFKVSSLLSSFLLVGITEEILFRGWIYNALLTCTSDIVAMIIQALLFVLLHFPGYMYIGEMFSIMAIQNYILVFILGLIFAWSFKKSKSLWTPIVLHMAWDLLMLLVI